MELILSVLIPILFVALLIIERVFPGQEQPKVRFWLLKGIVFFVFTGLVNAIMPAVFASLLNGYSPIHLTSLGTIPSALVGVIAVDFVAYWTHRSMHKVPRLWRWTHQMHHSAERMDLSGLAYTHPFDTLLTFALTTIATLLLGLSPDAAALVGFVTFAGAAFQHANIRTPKWLGYFVYRPEQHGLHHQRDVHAYNYGTFPIWDVVFRTYRNPAAFAQYGFWDGASAEMGEMLLGRDVGTPITKVPSQPALQLQRT